MLLAVGTHALIEDPVALPGWPWRWWTSSTASACASAWPCARRARPASRPMLMMSATPIPRTLAMSYYADLDVSVLDELPPGARPSSPSWSDERRDEVIRRVRDACLRAARPTGCAR
jgi:ATP-dependent DNA helicase RecG